MDLSNEDLALCRLSWTEARHALDDVDWLAPTALDRARAALDRYFVALAAEWLRWSAAHGFGHERFVRNLIVDAEPHQFALYRLALNRLATVDAPTWSGLATTLDPVLPVANGRYSFIAQVAEGTRPDTAATTAFFHRAQNAGLGCLLLHGPNGGPSASRDAAERVRDYFGSDVSQIGPATAAILSACWRQGLPQLTPADVALWRPDLQSAVLADADARLVMLQPDFAAALGRSPEAIPFSPKWWIDHRAAHRCYRQALVDFRQGRLDSDAARAVLVEAQSRRRFGERLLAAMDKAPPQTVGPLVSTAALEAQYSQVQPEGLRLRLRHLITSAAHRLQTLEGVPDDGWSWFIEHLSPETWAASLAASDEPALVERALELLTKHPAQLDILSRAIGLLPPDTVQPAVADSLFAALLRACAGQPMAQWLESVSVSLLAIPPVTSRIAPVLLDPAMLADDLDTVSRLWERLPNDLSARLITSDRPAAKRLFAQLLAHMIEQRQGGGIHWLASAVPADADWSWPDLLASTSMDDARFWLICDNLAGAVAAPLVQSMLDLRDKRDRPSWLRCLRRLRRRQGVVPEALHSAINGRRAAQPSDAPDPLVLAVGAYPEAFGDQAIAELWPIKVDWPYAFLEAVFDCPALARKVMARQAASQSGADPLKLVHAVRNRFGDQPTKAAAYELAAAFSLVDARYLWWLARRATTVDSGRAPGTHFDPLYHSYTLPKDSGGTRPITAPDLRLKRLQRRLLDVAFNAVALHSAAHGFRPEHSIATNARPHVGKAMVVNVDIVAFFPSTRYPLILEACRKVLGGRLSSQSSRLLADICSYGGGLPTGAPTSPAIANIVLTAADHALSAAAERYGISYTRYADDLTFSGPGETLRIIPFVARVLGDYGYMLDPNKTNIFRRGRRQSVTGLVVNEDVNVPRRIRRRLRAAVHHRVTGKQPHWHGKPMDDMRLMAYLAYLNVANSAEAALHRQQLDQYDTKPGKVG